MALEDIVKGIREKASREVEEIRREVDKRREEIIKKAKEEADKIKGEVLRRAKEEGESESQRRLMKVRSEERKKILALKRKLLDKAFEQARERLYNSSEEEYLSWLERALLFNIDSGDEEIIISPRDEKLIKRIFSEELKKNLRAKGKKDIKFFPELNEKEKGFIIRKEGIQVNYTFSTLFLFLKDKLEIEVAKRLFGF